MNTMFFDKGIFHVLQGTLHFSAAAGNAVAVLLAGAVSGCFLSVETAAVPAKAVVSFFWEAPLKGTLLP